MKNMFDIMKQAQQLQSRMQDMQAELERAEVEGRSGGGLVALVMSGKGEIRKLSIDPSLMKEDEREVLEDLVVAAAADAKTKAEALAAEKLKSVTGGLPLPPGLGL
ncbi:MAG: YbaB/EbfC family nucleoid-associated protein [Parvibaculum sp.]